MIKFAHIAPKTCMGPAMHKSQIHMALYHIAKEDDVYCKKFKMTEHEVILDNSWFELGTTPPIEDLIEVAGRVGATYIVLPDGTLDGIDDVRQAGFKAMAVPAGPNMLDQAIMWLRNAKVAKVAISFTHAASAVGVHKLNPAARYLALQHIDAQWQGSIPTNRIHFLGMGDSVHEIMLVKPWWHTIYSWDTSAAVWAGIHDRDVSSMKGKFKLGVNFGTVMEWTDTAGKNCSYINKMTKD